MRASPHSHVTLTVLIAVLPAIASFLLPITTPQCLQPPATAAPPLGVSHSRSRPSRLYDYMSVVEDPSTALFAGLNLPPSTTADRKEMKRAYKRVALNYHPDDVIIHTNQDQDHPPYYAAPLSPKDKTAATSPTTNTSPSMRRTQQQQHHHYPNQWCTHGQVVPQPNYDFNVNQALNDWKEYKDLVHGGGGGGAAAVVAAGKRDRVKSSQEGHVDGYNAARAVEKEEEECDDDANDLQTLLRVGSVQQVAMRLRDAELVVQELDSKRKRLMEERRMRQAKYDCKTSSSSFYLYLEKKELDQDVAQLQLQIQCVERDLTRVHKRWRALQMRHDEQQVVETTTTTTTTAHSSARRHHHHHGSSSRSSSQSTSSSYSRTTCSPTLNASTVSSLASTGSDDDDDEESPSQSPSFPHLETTSTSPRATYIGSRTLVVSATPPRQESSSTTSATSNHGGSTTLASSTTTTPPPPLRQELSSLKKQGITCSNDSDSSFSSTTACTSENDDWKNEGFATSGRGRGSNRRRRSQEGDAPSTMTTTRGKSRNGSAASTSSSSDEDARKREGFGSFLEKARDTLLTFMICEIHRYAQGRISSSSTSSSSSSPKVTSTNGTAFSSGEDAWRFEGFGGGEGARGGDARWTASRMLDEHVDNPAQDKSAPPAPNPDISAEAVALKLVEFSSSSKLKRTGATGMAEQSHTDEEKKPVIDNEKAKGSLLQYPLVGELDHISTEKLAGHTDAEDNSPCVDLFQDEIVAPIQASRAELIVAAIENAQETLVESLRKAKSEEKTEKEGTRGHLFHKEILAPIEAARTESIVAALENAKETLVESVRRAKSKEAKKKADNAKKRVVLLTRHIRVLEAHKKKLPTGYFKVENARGDVLGSLCSVFSIPAKKMDGTPKKADDKRNSLREELGTESPRTVFDDALEDLKQQLVSTKNDKRNEKAKKGTRDDVSATRKKKDNAKKRVLWLTKHISILEAHKEKLPTGYWMAENAKGGVLGSLCGIFSIPATKKDGTTNKADDKRHAIHEILGEESPKTVFDDALEDLKQQLVSEMIAAS